MKRFPLELPDDLHTDFIRAFPAHGERTTLIRKCIRRLIQRAKLVDVEIHRVADGVYDDRKEG